MSQRLQAGVWLHTSLECLSESAGQQPKPLREASHRIEKFLSLMKFKCLNLLRCKAEVFHFRAIKMSQHLPAFLRCTVFSAKMIFNLLKNVEDRLMDLLGRKL